MKYLIAVDIGGTTFSFFIFKNKNIIFKSSIYDIKKYENAQIFFSELYSIIINNINDENLIEFIGIACPGPLDSKTGIVLNPPNLKIFHNVNFKKELNKYFQTGNIYIENDANIYTKGFYYKLNNYNINDVVLGITLGTGIGFGIIINGKLFNGSYGMAGEYEFSPLNNDLTWADLIGCIFFKEITNKKFNKEISPRELFDLAEKKNNEALKIWETYGNNIGLCLSHVISLINPNYISIGGGISKASKYFHEFIIKKLKEKCIIFNENLINISYDNDRSNIYYGWF